MKKKEKVTEYKNFWLIWLNCAGKPDRGESLFKIQTKWGINTNYLYHNEAGLGKPLYTRMLKDGYIYKEGPRLKPVFTWIPGYVKTQAGVTTGDSWYPSTLISSKWPDVQKFIEENSSVLFSQEAMRTLYKNDRNLLGLSGGLIFRDVFLYVLFSNLIYFTKKYKADIVMRILSTSISIFAERDLLNYIRHLHGKLFKEVPAIITTEQEMNRLMYPFGW
jgi:hypothetical protein